MGRNSSIEWCDHTFNPWIGCTPISAGCDHCYARRTGARLRVQWGSGQPRSRAADSTWRQPLAWDRRAAREGTRPRVFLSLCDPFDTEVPDAWRESLFALMVRTPHLLWLPLTKRPHVMLRVLTTVARSPPNVVLGTSAENQAMADARHGPMAALAAAGWRTYVSHGPALGPVDWAGWAFLSGMVAEGESGPGARAPHPDWFRADRDWCAAHGVPFNFKQWGEWMPTADAGRAALLSIKQRHGRVDTVGISRVGKKAAGRRLDGRTHDGVPG